MFTRIEALNYSCLRYVSQELGPFHVLVGPNASGKSTFLDVVGFLHDFVTKGVEAAVRVRSSNFYDLVWRHEGDGFELAVEAPIPKSLRDSLEDQRCTTIRYEVAVRLDGTSNQLEIAAEQAWLRGDPGLRGSPRYVPRDALVDRNAVARNGLLRDDCLFARYRGPDGRYGAHFRATGRVPQISVSTGRRSLLGMLPDTDLLHPVSRWLPVGLLDRVERISLSGKALRIPSPPGEGSRLDGGGGNLPWAVHDLQLGNPERFHQWVEHLQTALPDLLDITTIERPEHRDRYLSLQYRDGLKVPSWNVSDGTLRLLALTLLAYFRDFEGTLLVEEPENGLHPLAIETVYQSLSSIYEGQVLLATHSPLLVAIAKPGEVLCFTKQEDGSAHIVSGDRHPRLSDWRGEVDLGTLFASGVLG